MTLVELVISIGIFILIMGAVVLFESNVFSFRRNVSGTFQVVQNAQLILKTLNAEIRSMSPGANGAYPLITAGTSSVSFFSDVNADGTTEQVRYFLTNGQLYQGITQPSGSPVVYNSSGEVVSGLLAGVSNDNTSPVFEYFDGNYTGTSSPLSLPIQANTVRLIRINLNLISPDSATPKIYTTDVMLRNLKDNL